MWMYGYLKPKPQEPEPEPVGRTPYYYVGYSSDFGTVCSLNNSGTLWEEGGVFYENETGPELAPDGYYTEPGSPKKRRQIFGGIDYGYGPDC